MELDQWIMGHEAPIRLGFFLGIFTLMALWELISPRRVLSLGRGRRWSANVGIVVLNTVLLRIVFPTAAVGVAIFAGEAQWGLFNHFPVPFWAALALSVLLLDFAIYLQHVMFHAVPVLWRLHRMHHADLDYDFTTGARFHPIEILLSMLIKFAAIVVLGAPAVAVVIFEVLLNATAMFNHGNVRLPEGVDRIARLFVVTPDMHRVHHSIYRDEANSNFGFNVPWWDWLCGTYRPQPRDGHEAMTLGIDGFREPRRADGLWGMLLMPFAGPAGAYAITGEGAEALRKSGAAPVTGAEPAGGGE
jgi:sterol desaturase/sphingolipid hydroxylase (fatty acid hydroxylase superfamily)